MQIQPWMIKYAEAQPWDSDLRQDLYIKLMEMDEKTISTDYLSRAYTNMKTDKMRVDGRRREIEDESVEYIVQALGLNDVTADPMDQLMAEEAIAIRLKELSPLLRATLERVVIDGVTPEDMAVEEGTSVNVIYQRVHQAKAILRGENNE